MLILISLGILAAVFLAGCIGDFIDRGKDSVGAKIIINIAKSHSKSRKNKHNRDNATHK